MLGNFPITTTLRCADVKRQAGWYSEVLGLRVINRSDMGEVTLEAGSGTRVSLYPGPTTKADHTLMCFTVPDIRAAIRTLEGKGVKFEDYDMPGLKTVNHIAASADGQAAWFRDTESNYIGLVQDSKT